MYPQMLRRIKVAFVLSVIGKERLGGREGLLLPLLFDLGCGQLVAGAWGVAPLGAGHGQFRLVPTGLPHPYLLLWWGCVGLYVVLGQAVQVVPWLTFLLQGIGGFG